MRWELILIGLLALVAWFAIGAATLLGLAELVVPR